MQSFLGDQKLVNLPRISLPTFLSTPRRAAVAFFLCVSHTRVGVNESRGCKRRSLFHVSLFFLPASFQCCFFPSSFFFFFFSTQWFPLFSLRRSCSLSWWWSQQEEQEWQAHDDDEQECSINFSLCNLVGNFFIFSKVFLLLSFQQKILSTLRSGEMLLQRRWSMFGSRPSEKRGELKFNWKLIHDGEQQQACRNFPSTAESVIP